MASRGQLLARAREKLEVLREKNLDEQSRRLDEVYRLVPKIREIDIKLREQMPELMLLSMKNGAYNREKFEELEAKNLGLQIERAELLADFGYPIDYNDEIYSCKICKDTGMIGAKTCFCLEKLYKQEVNRELSGLLRYGNERFSDFNLNLYSDRPEPATGKVPREHMKIIYNICYEYAQTFSDNSPNLMFSGSPGLGKTFLSACIARALSDKGFSIAYESAATAFECFELVKFGRDLAQSDAANSKIRHYLDCDLLILDDLGTELITPMSQSSLYTIVNTRLLANKKTIISTNFTKERLRKEYTAQICSRLEGEYISLDFVGSDIRQMKMK